MRGTLFSLAPVLALALVVWILASCTEDPLDPLADEENFDRTVLGVQAGAGDRTVEVYWQLGFLQSKPWHAWDQTRYRLLFSETGLSDLQPVVEAELGDRHSGSHLFENLENDRSYYFAVQIVNIAAGGLLSRTVMAVPHVENPTEYVLSPQQHEQRYAAWSPDGGSIAYVGYYDSTAADTGQEYLWDVLFIHDLSTRQSTRYVDHAIAPSWSPDSRRLVFVVEFNRQALIKVLDIDSRRVATLTDGSTWDLSPSWSPRGERIVYRAETGGSSNELRLYDFATKVSTTLITGQVPWVYPSDLFSTPSWTPSSDAIVLARRRIESEDSERDIYTMAVDGGDLQPVVESPWDDFQPAYSPDGTRLAFLSNRSGTTAIWTKDLVTETLAQITSEGAVPGSLSWSADGTQIVYIGYRNHLRTPKTVTVIDPR